MDENELETEVRESLATAAAIDAELLVRTDLGENYRFEEAIPHFTKPLSVVKQLAVRDVSCLPYSQLNNILNCCTDLSRLRTSVTSFSMQMDSPTAQYRALLKSIEETCDTVLCNLMQPLAFVTIHDSDLESLNSRAASSFSSVESALDAAMTQIRDATEEAKLALGAIKDQAAMSGVSVNAKVFSEHALDHRTASKKWLWAAVLSAGFTIGAAVYWLESDHLASSIPSTIQYVFAKLILLSLLSYAMIWCGKNYRSHKHNETLNQHRANALMTFQAFVQGTSEQSIKDTILVHAAQAAFGMHPTGYDSMDKDVHPIAPAIEIIANSFPKSPS